jgi:hypothetical protein
LLEITKVSDGILSEVNSLDVDSRLSQWVSLFSLVFSLSLDGSWFTTSTDLVVPFLEATIFFHSLSVMLLGKLAAIAFLILSEVTLEFLALTIGLAGLTLSEDHCSTDILLLELLRLSDGVVVATSVWAKFGVTLHLITESSLGCFLDRLLVESVKIDSSEV